MDMGLCICNMMSASLALLRGRSILWHLLKTGSTHGFSFPRSAWATQAATLWVGFVALVAWSLLSSPQSSPDGPFPRRAWERDFGSINILSACHSPLSPPHWRVTLPAQGL